METDTELGEITVAQVEAPPENAAAVDANNPTAPARFAFRDIFRKPGYVAVVGLMLIIAKFILDNITIFIFTIMSVVVVGYWQV